MIRVITDGPGDWIVTAYGRTVARFSGRDAVFEALDWARRYRAS